MPKYIARKIEKAEEKLRKGDYSGLEDLKSTFDTVTRMTDADERTQYLENIDNMVREVETQRLSAYGKKDSVYIKALELSEEVAEELRGKEVERQMRKPQRGTSRYGQPDPTRKDAPRNKYRESRLRQIVGIFLGVAGIIIGIAMVYPVITGNVISESPGMAQNMMGMAILVLGIAGILVSMKRKQQS